MTDRLPDPRFPVPTRPSKLGKSSGESQFFREIDIGAGFWVMNDGRPARFENWLDCDTKTFCRTVFYSTLDAEEWDERRHYDFLLENELLKDKTYPTQSAGICRTENENGQSLWSVTVAIFDEED